MKKISSILCAVLCTISLIACAQNKQKDTTMNNEAQKKKILVVYFSRTGENYGVGNITKGNTRIVAEMIANETGGDLFEIVPAKAYPTEYERCTEVVEKEKTANARPEIKTDKDISGYDVVFIGYPIWWGDAPMPVYTWIERHEWQGKTVVPFCTHEGSGLGSTPSRIGKACKGATIGDSFELTGTTAQKRQSEAQKAVHKWIGGLGL